MQQAFRDEKQYQMSLSHTFAHNAKLRLEMVERSHRRAIKASSPTSLSITSVIDDEVICF